MRKVIPDFNIKSFENNSSKDIAAAGERFATLDTSSIYTVSQKRRRRKKADVCDLAFAKIYFPAIFNEPWNDIHRHIASLTEGFYTVSGARRFGKSAFTYVAKVIKPIAIGGPGIVNISLRTRRAAIERTAAIARLIKRNNLLVYDYEIDFTQEQKGYYIINNKHLVATSVMVGLRSITDDEFKRFAISVNDDLYFKDSVKSPGDNKKVYDFVTSEVYGQMETDGLSITLGNSISDDCPIRLIAADFPGNHFSLPATDTEGHTNWPGHSLFTDDYWLEIQKNMPLEVWMGEYMDTPLIRGDIFDTAWIRFTRPADHTYTAIISALDPASGESPAACYKALVTVGLTPDERVVVLDIYLRREPFDLVFAYTDNLRRRLGPWKTLLFENDFNQWYLAEPFYRQWMETSGKSLPIHRYSSKSLKSEGHGSDKDSRILNLVYPHQTGTILYSRELEGSADFELYRSQYSAYGALKDNVDGLDALAAAFIMVRRYAESGSFKPLKSRYGKEKGIF